LLIVALLAGAPRLPRLDDLRACVLAKKQTTPDGTCGPFRYGGVEFIREIDLGAGRRVFAASGHFTSGLVLYDATGAALGHVATGGLEWLSLIDLDGDNEAELVGEQIVGQGTGVLTKEFFILKASGAGFARLWSARSYNFVEQADANGHVTTTKEQGRLAFGGKQLVYTLSNDGRTTKSVVLQWRNGRLAEAPWSSTK
jgi:hypothetical protein